ncbi:MAG TPA: GNAT family protein [Dehalococcoidia bacterium]|nr:GNAT family protein [Dehalococcoidia bacterium]
MLEGKLVRLRPMEPDEVDNYYRWLNDSEVKQYLNMRYFFSRASEAEWLRSRTNQPLSYNNLQFAVDVLKDGRHIGSIGLHEAHAEDRKATVGIAIGDRTAWDQGYGTDAMITLLRFAFDEMNLHRVMLTVDERNLRAVASYKKCGFLEEGRLRDDRYARGKYWATLVMGVLEDEFRALHGAQA